ncbi:MAG: glycosyltransferase family 2 protein [Rikenellaceae bacterium]
MVKPKISIITVVRNAKSELERTIENVVKLNYNNIEFIVVDGLSTDGTKEIIEKNSLNITRWISEADKGIYDAMNKGLEMASGDYVWFINAGDEIYSPETLNYIFSGVENPSDIYYGETLILSQDGKTKGLRGKKPPRKLTVRSFKYGMNICHQSIIVRRKIAPKYDLSYRFAADIDWILEAVRKSRSSTNTHQILSRFIEGGISSINRKKSLIERYNIMVKHYGKSSTIFYHLVILFRMLKPKYRKVSGLLKSGELKGQF